ncbi:MAG TPA: tRNA-dihydrouridine synthase family protein, partial [Candidatus Paceibacterota bacterium]|nr:tRNA-dihydrouridine synthase family protein [Candidatus Paceibacterota bacterium]
MNNFWQTLPKPFFALAPLEDVTDAAFRCLIAKKGKPDVMFTEFTSADGLALAPEEGKRRLLKKLEFSEGERPIVAQLFSAYPDRMETAAQMVRALGFDGLDINMGCPDRAIEKSLCGAAMIENPSLAKEIIRAAQRGAEGMPVSVKTRIGYAKNEISTWVPALLEEGIAALTIHARTRNEMSDVPARWEHVKETVDIRDRLGVPTLILGNGDLTDLADAREKVKTHGADGAMLGRA